jgi:O-antigen ligase/tetratricopeptide (TPR) repeat protein
MKILEKILRYGLILSLLTPLVIGDSLIFPFVSTKAYFFYILVDILLIVYLALLSQKKLYPNKNKLFLFFVGLISLTFIFDIFGIGFKNSFWGNYERMMGIFTSIHFIIYFWILLSVFNTPKKYLKLLNISLIVSFLVGIYGILQKLDIHFFGIVNIADHRISATFGNPAYLAGFALLFIFLAAYLFFKNENKYWRIFYFITTILNLFTLYLTVTRGAWFGLFMAILSMLLYLMIFYQRKKIKIISAGIFILIILLTSSVFIFKDSSLVQNNTNLKRISEIGLQDTTTMSRLLLWQMSFQAMEERPIFGYGVNNIRIPLDRYHDYNLVEDWFDSSHNKFLDELLAHGVIGFMLQLAFFIWLFFLVIKKRKSDILGNMILLGLLTAYVTQALFIFDSFIIGWLFVFVLGFITINLYDQEESKVINKKPPTWLVGLLVLVLLVGLPFLYFKSISPAQKIALAFETTEVNFDDTIKLYESANETLFFSYDILAPTMAKTAIKIFDNPQQYTDVQLKEFMTLTDQVFHQAINDSDHYSKFYINLAKVYQFASRHPRLDYIDQSMDLLGQALEYAPNRIDIYYALAQGYFLQDDIDKAEEALYQALDLDVRQFNTYSNLVEIQMRRGAIPEAMTNLRHAGEFGNMNFSDLETFAKILVQREAWEAVIEVLVNMQQLQPNDVNIYSNIALAYSQTGEKDQAIEWINKILEIDPSYQEQVQQFIDSL